MSQKVPSQWIIIRGNNLRRSGRDFLPIKASLCIIPTVYDLREVLHYSPIASFFQIFSNAIFRTVQR